MENTAEGGDLSSMANHSPVAGSSGGECSATASEESGWTTYIDYFMATQQQHFIKEATSSGACTSPSTNVDASESVGDHGAGAGGVVASFAEVSRLPALVDSSEASRRLSFWRRKEGVRRMKLMRDESLEDTATSPISSPKLIDSRDSDGSHKKKEDACDEISHIPKKTSDELDCDDNYINSIENGEDASTDMISDDDAYDQAQPAEEERPLLGPCACLPCIVDL